MPNTELKTPPEAQGARGLYDAQIDRFRKAMAEDNEDAFGRYGFALFHSLSLEEQYLFKNEYGIVAQTAEDLYNLGLAFASREDFDKAISCWNQSIKLDPAMAEAHYNLAVAAERAKNLSVARKHYNHYLELIQDPEEISLIKQHLEEMES